AESAAWLAPSPGMWSRPRRRASSSLSRPRTSCTCSPSGETLVASRRDRLGFAPMAEARRARFGVTLPQIKRTWDETRAAAVEFERLGFDSLWVCDHLYSVPM